MVPSLSVPGANALPSSLPGIGQVSSTLPLTLPTIGPVTQVTNTLGQTLYHIPGTDPASALGLSMVSSILGLIANDAGTLFSPGSSTHGEERRDSSEGLDARSPQLPSLNGVAGSVPGAAGSLPVASSIGSVPVASTLPGIPTVPGVSPDIMSLANNVANKLPIPGGIGPVQSYLANWLSNSVVPSFVLQLPANWSLSSILACLQLLGELNPTQYGSFLQIGNYTDLAAAASGLSASDVALVRSMPVAPASSSLVPQLVNFVGELTQLPGKAQDVKGAAAALAMKTAGLAIPGQ